MQPNQSPAIDQKQLALIQERLKLANVVNNSAGWFYAIAVFSLINSVFFLAGGGWSFFIGLGVTQLLDGFVTGFGRELVNNATTILRVGAFAGDLIVAGIFAAFGFFARKKHKWAFIGGMLLYGLDALVFLPFRDFVSFGFHLFVLFGLYAGLKTIDKLNALEQTQTV